MVEQDKIKQAIKNAFLDMKENNLSFLPESYLSAFCKQAKLLNLKIDECDWFNIWSDKFDVYIKKELNNYPIKNKDDFINALSTIINNKSNAKYDSLKVLKKALKILKNKNILDLDSNLPLESIDKELTKFILSDSNNLFNLVHLDNLLSPNDVSLKAKMYDSGYALICNICCFENIKENFGIDALEKLFNAFYRILLNSIDTNSSIGIYEDSAIVILLPNYTINTAESCLQNIKNNIYNFLWNTIYLYIYIFKTASKSVPCFFFIFI